MYFQARDDLLFHRAGDSWLLVDPETDRVHRLNEIAMWIWRHADGVTSEQELSRRLADLTQAPLERVTADVGATFRDIQALDLVREVSGQWAEGRGQ